MIINHVPADKTEDLEHCFFTHLAKVDMWMQYPWNHIKSGSPLISCQHATIKHCISIREWSKKELVKPDMFCCWSI